MQRDSCGSNLRWTLDDDGTLIIGGVRELNFVNEEPPRLDRCERIQKLVVGDGVEKNIRVVIPNSTLHF